MCESASSAWQERCVRISELHSQLRECSILGRRGDIQDQTNQKECIFTTLCFMVIWCCLTFVRCSIIEYSFIKV